MAYPEDIYTGIDLVIQDLIRGYCGWHISPEMTETVVLDAPPGGKLLLLPSLYVTEISSLKVDGRPLSGPFEFSPSGMVRGNFGCKLGSIEVTFTHGYEDAPRAVYAAVERLTALGYDDPVVAAGAGSGVKIGAVSETPSKAAVSDVQGTTGDKYVDAVLGPYRLGLRP